MREIVIPSDLVAAKEPEREILRAVSQHRYDEETVFAIRLAFEEAITNAVKHGNGNDRSKKVRVRFGVNSEKIVIVVNDEGSGFLPEQVPDPTKPDRLSLPDGRGIMLMRAYMNKVEYRRNGSELLLVKVNES